MDKDQELIVAYLSGDREALDRLIHLYFLPLYNFIFLLVREKEATEDVLQETFIKTWKHLVTFDQKQKFKTWLYTIAKNTAFDFLKKKKSLSFSMLGNEEDFLENYPDERLDIIEELSKEEAVKEIELALEKIPEHYRALLILVYREDFSLREVAEILGEPYNTIKNRHTRGIAKLRTLMRPRSLETRTNA